MHVRTAVAALILISSLPGCTAVISTIKVVSADHAVREVGSRGASQLALSGTESPEMLRQRVTSKGGTTYAALTSMQNANMGPLFQVALQAAQQRAHELGDEFGR